VFIDYPNRYKEFLDFVRDPLNEFLSLIIPFSEGLEIMVYQPGQVFDLNNFSLYSLDLFMSSQHYSIKIKNKNKKGGRHGHQKRCRV
jgi:hypothetical protein